MVREKLMRLIRRDQNSLSILVVLEKMSLALLSLSANTFFLSVRHPACCSCWTQLESVFKIHYIPLDTANLLVSPLWDLYCAALLLIITQVDL